MCVQLLPHIRACAKERPSFPVITWQEFVSKVKEINKTADEEGVRNVAFYLNESAEVRENISLSHGISTLPWLPQVRKWSGKSPEMLF